MTTFLICATALLLDAASIYLLLVPIALPAPSPLVFLVVHGLASLLFGASFCRILSPHKGTERWTALFALTVAGLFPLLGICGLLALAVTMLRSQRREAVSKDIAHTPIVPLPQHPAAPFESARAVSEGYLAGLLEHSTNAQQRLAALIATLSLQDGQAAPLLRLALKDHDDDVRLLAYALLDRKERAIESRIREQQSQLDHANDDSRFALHKALANDFWELARLNSGSAAEYLCRRAHEHGQAALQLRETDGGLQFLLGRIQLQQTQLDEARVAFKNAEQCGIDSRTTSSYLAEIAFRQLRFTEAVQRLHSGPTVRHPRSPDFIGPADLVETNQ